MAVSASWSILYKEFVDISYDNASLGIQKDSVHMTAAYLFFNYNCILFYEMFSKYSV